MKKQELITILIPTFICVIAWIGFNIYHSGVTSTISPQEINQINPINSSFNTKVIENLKKRERIETSFMDSSQSAKIIIQTPSPTPTKTASPKSSESAILNTQEEEEK